MQNSVAAGELGEKNICMAPLRGERQTAVGAHTNETGRRQQISGQRMIHAFHYDTLPSPKVSALSRKVRAHSSDFSEDF